MCRLSHSEGKPCNVPSGAEPPPAADALQPPLRCGAAFGISTQTSQTTMDKKHILREIQRTAETNGSVPLGRLRFFRETSIKESDWLANTGLVGVMPFVKLVIRRINVRERTMKGCCSPSMSNSLGSWVTCLSTVNCASKLVATPRSPATRPSHALA